MDFFMYNKVIMNIPRPFPEKIVHGLRAGLAILVLAALILNSFRAQWTLTARPLLSRSRDISTMLRLTDLEKLTALAPNYSVLIRELRRYPEGTNFYFVPEFQDSQNRGFWWWYLYLLTRYYVYPRKLFCHDSVLDDGRKDVFIQRWIGGAKTFSEISWVKEKKIDRIILIRHNKAEILPVSAKVEGL